VRARKSHTADLDHIASPLEKLRFVVERFVTEPSPLPGGCPYLNSAVDTDDGNAKLRALARKAFADWRARLADIVQQAVAAGEIRPELNPQHLADTLIATLEGALVMSRIGRDPAPLQGAHAMLEILLTSVSRTGAEGSRRPA
jgi:TetR/AcrR family transcriptional regulator, transcriptional repressor for nem operon